MVNTGRATHWPMLLDLTKDECRKKLRSLELEAYNSVVTVLRAQGAFTPEKKRLLQDLANMLGISIERHRAEVRQAVNCERLATIAQHMSGPNTALGWIKEGHRIVPPMTNHVPETSYIDIANSVLNIVAARNSQLPQPSETSKKREVKQEIGSINGDSTSPCNNISTSTITSPAVVTSQSPSLNVITPNTPKPPPSSTANKPLTPPCPSPCSTSTTTVLSVPPLQESLPTFKVPAVPPNLSPESDISANSVAPPVTVAASTSSTIHNPSTEVISAPTTTIPYVSSTSNTKLNLVTPTPSLPSITITPPAVPLITPSNKSATSDSTLSSTTHPLKTCTISVIPSTSIVQSVTPQISTSTSNSFPCDTSTLIVVPPSSTLSNPLSPTSSTSLLSFSIDDSPSSTSIDSTLNSVVATISECPPEITSLPSTDSTISAPKQIPVSNAIVSISADLSSISASSFLSSIPLISIPPSTAFSSSVVNSAAVPITSSSEVVDLEKPSATTLLKDMDQKSEKLQDEVEDFNAGKIQPLSPGPTLVLPSGMSIQLREGDIDKPKKRKRSLSQDASMTIHKKLMTVPVTKITTPLPSRAMSIQAPVKISVNTPAITRTSSTTANTSSQKVIIVSNTSSAANSPNSVLQKSLCIVKTNRNRFQNPQVTGSSLQSSNTKLRPKMVTVPAKYSPRNSSIVIPASSSIQNIQMKSDNTLDVDSTVKCLAVPNISGTTRILPKPSSMLIVNPTTSVQKVSLSSDNTSCIDFHAEPEVKLNKSSTKQAGKSNVVIVHKGSVSKGLKITNASKDLVNKVLTSKPISVQSKLPAANKQQTTSPPMTTAGTSGNVILLDLNQDQYNRNSTLAEILQASVILPTSLSLQGSSESQNILSPGVESGVQSSEWIQDDDCKSSQDASLTQEDINDDVLDFLEESTANDTSETEENVEPDFGQSELDLEEQQVFSITTDVSENDIAFIARDKQVDSQSDQIIIEADSAQDSDEQHSQITCLPLMNAPVTIQHSDIDASNILLEDYTSQQIENQTLT